jgi:hypothetical protein
VREESSSGRQATPNKAFEFLGPAFRDQEVAGSNPFARSHRFWVRPPREAERVRTRGAIRAPGTIDTATRYQIPISRGHVVLSGRRHGDGIDMSREFRANDEAARTVGDESP